MFVSEVMLQQTQVSRVEKKFPDFIKKFPGFTSLVKASTKEILQTWQGMGYNRRALYLKKAAEVIVKKYKGHVPKNLLVLETLPGIGRVTANSIAAFSWNRPTVFIETNIRRVFIHFFFSGRENIDDRDILPLVKKTLDQKNPREWYWALMDYGSHLPKITRNPNTKSKHYKKQSRFNGSDREIRGVIVTLILKNPLTINQLKEITGFERKRLLYNLLELKDEGFITEKNGKYCIK